MENINVEELNKKSKHIRNLLLDMCVKAETGHVTSSFSCTEIMVALYYGGILKFDPKNPQMKDRDRFILSKGHASVILYPILADLGFFSISELDRFAQAGGIFGVHLQNNVPGVEITSGSLGHGLGVAAGLALAAKMNRESYMTFVLLGDGECYEGSVWESAMFASHHRLNNLVAIVDRNYLCCSDFTEDTVALEPMQKKWESFGWKTINVDGHSIEEILKSLSGFRSRKSSNPLVIIAHTTKGKGVSFMSDVPLWHAVAPKGQEAIDAKNEINK